MKRTFLGIAAAMLVIGTAAAQTTAAGYAGTTGQQAASGNDNQAVATTAANAATPAHGHNSFTMGEARRRIESRGFASAHALHKDANGVWRGQAKKDGAAAAVWLDYKGNVGSGTDAE